MNETQAAVSRVLVIHPDEEQRAGLEKLLRRIVGGPVTVYQAPAAAAGLAAVRRLDPRVVLLDLNDEPALALDVAREARRPGRLIVGLYNPLLLPDGEAAAFFRQASRAGIADFVPLPAGESELAEALAGAAAADAADGSSEGHLVAFLSAKGGVGTTTLAASTALSLVGSERVTGGIVLCDAALPFGTAAPMLGLAPDRDLADLVHNLDDLKALGPYLTHEEHSHLALLPAPRDLYRVAEIGPEELSRVLILLRRRFARVVVDVAAGLDLLSLAAIDLAERVYVVTEAWAPTVLATARLVRLLEEQELSGDRLRLVLNRYSDAEDLGVDLVTERIGRPVDFVVPFDSRVAAGGNRGESPVLTRADGAFAGAIGAIADDVAGIAGGERG